jgi:hypothetical protein
MNADEMNDKSVELTGKFSSHQFQLTENLNEDFDVLCKVRGELAGINKKLTNDSYKYVNTIGVLEVIDIIECNTKTKKYENKIKRGKTSNVTMSQEMRMWIEDLWEAKGREGDKEQFYINYMSKLINKIKAEVQIERDEL